GEEAVRRNLDRDDRVAAPSRTFLPLACEADFGPVLEPLGEFEVDCLAVGQRDPLWLQRNRVVEGDLEPVGDVRAFLRRRALAEPAERAAASRTAARRAAEQPFEQVAEVGGVGAAEIEILETLSARSGAGARSGARRIAAEAAAKRHLGIAVLIDLTAVVARALVLVRQQVIGGCHLGEALRRIGLVLVAVWVELLGETPVGLLDLRLASAALQPEALVEVECHCPPMP